jgi:hypothetical protein
MNEIALSRVNETLPGLVRIAAQRLAAAENSAEILDARDLARHAYDVAKSTAHIARAKQAHDELVVAACRAQADAVCIEVRAKRRLADEYDAAQERGEIRGNGGDHISQAGKVLQAETPGAAPAMSAEECNRAVASAKEIIARGPPA